MVVAQITERRERDRWSDREQTAGRHAFDEGGLESFGFDSDIARYREWSRIERRTRRGQSAVQGIAESGTGIRMKQ